jgi:hypothetical protein
MQQFVKNLIAAGILFASLITSVALGYAIIPSSDMAKKPVEKAVVKLKLDKKEIRFNLNHSLKLLTPTVND